MKEPDYIIIEIDQDGDWMSVVFPDAGIWPKDLALNEIARQKVKKPYRNFALCRVEGVMKGQIFEEATIHQPVTTNHE